MSTYYGRAGENEPEVSFSSLASHTVVTGARFKATSSVFKSLQCLSDVFIGTTSLFNSYLTHPDT